MTVADLREFERDELLRQAGVPRPRGKRRKGGVGPNDVTPRAEATARRLVKLLRAQAGIPVRLPAHHASPFRAEPIAFSFQNTLAGPGAGVASVTRFGVLWNPVSDAVFGTTNAVMDTPANAEGFPDGYRGVVTRIQCWMFQHVTAAPFIASRQVRWSAFKNGSPINGYQRQIPSSTQDQTLVGVTSSNATIDVAVRVPVQLNAGDTLEGEFVLNDLGAPVTVTSVFLVEGYRFPVKGEDDTIYATLVD